MTNNEANTQKAIEFIQALTFISVILPLPILVDLLLSAAVASAALRALPYCLLISFLEHILVLDVVGHWAFVRCVF